ncbi:carbonic anhydrase-related protein 10-like [Oratosquilla oratoria]|uniref:carbonic anhydrase-related protein 10-like n=1 Tax=Oratosquilla oratoria TaxID=337810 RepID=UPI003F75D3A2
MGQSDIDWDDMLVEQYANVRKDSCGLGVSWDWSKWWTYDGISGPQYWGLINPEWSLCAKGRRQSPVNLEPTVLLYDPNLRPLHVDKHRVSGVVNNTGHSVVFTVDDGSSGPSGVGTPNTGPSISVGPSTEDKGHSLGSHRGPPLNITGGPLSYRYQVSQLQLHFGSKNYIGSEHTVNGTSFPAEIQIYGFNAQLFTNFSEAVARAHGMVAISIMLKVASQGTPELRPLTDAIARIKFAGSTATVHRLSIRGLLPTTDHYMTYEGSQTQPPCHETVTWIVLNKPIYITQQQLHTLRELYQGTEDTPKAKMVNNYRPTQNLYHRPLRTNIDFTNSEQLNCPSMARQVYYTANTWR